MLRMDCPIEQLSPDCEWEFQAHRVNIRPSVNNTGVMISPKLAGLLCMGVAKRAYSFSWGQRGFPKNCSPQLKKIYGLARVVDMNFASYLSRHELQVKRAELLINPDPKALDVISELGELIEAMPPATGDPKRQRLVFWFPHSNI